jgi:hypothetical protein
MSKKPSYIDFNHEKFQKKLATKYYIKGEIGVLSYKYSKKISNHWKFKTPELAKISSNKIYEIFKKNLEKSYNYFLKGDKNNLIKYFIRADICRKFIQMGYTRAMRYYYHKDGKKWDYKVVDGEKKWYILPYDYDKEKKISANIFKKYLKKIINDKIYILIKNFFIKNANKIKFDYTSI